MQQSLTLLSVPPQLLGNRPTKMDQSNNEYMWNQITSRYSEVWRETSVNNRLCSLRLQIYTPTEVIRQKHPHPTPGTSCDFSKTQTECYRKRKTSQVQLKKSKVKYHTHSCADVWQTSAWTLILWRFYCEISATFDATLNTRAAKSWIMRTFIFLKCNLNWSHWYTPTKD